uniref:EGF-like domain-containing protein n=1 Tax=Anopheles quadriannulatus TaxID=34691 RepID=A0A182XBR0_ANOQN
MGLCENPCLFDGVCAETATCQAKMHRPICTCPPGHEGNPTIKCTVLESIQCTTNDECSLTEACVGNVCQRPCDVKNTCTANAVCINTNHGTDCSCIDGYHGNGFVQCVPVTTVGSVCQYNEDCPPDKLCDRLNRICINPCQADSCGDNAECFAVNHGIDCRCRAGYVGNAYIECTQHQGCLSDRQCNDNEACIQGRCSSPCQCGPNAMCDVKRHKAVCRCPPGYGGNARTGCNPPSNPCEPNPCGINAMCEIDNGSPVCFCPRGLTGNPFKNCIPEGNECTPNPCGPNSGCRKINGKPTCFCLPEFEGNPPQTPCTLPQNPCVPSPCGPNTQCTILSNGYAKCTCVPGYIESPNTIRGCVEPSSPCDPNPCGFGAICDATRNPVCYCPDSMIGNPYRSCLEPVVTPELCQPGPCGANADCYVAEGREQCYCKPNFIGDPYGGCVEQPRSVCEPNPCGPGAECVLLVDGAPGCRCPPGLSGDPTTTGCHAFECLSDDQCAADKACIGLRCADPCPGSCGAGAHCRVEKHHPVCFCDAGLTGNPAVQCYSLDERPRDACNPSPCGANARCSVRNKRPVCKCLTNYHGDPRKGCKPECDINSDCTPDKSCVNHKCLSPCALGTVCGVNAECSVNYHTPMCKCPSGYTGDAFVQCVPIPEDRNMTRQPCSSDPCGPGEVCSIYGNDVALCDPCVAPDAIHNPRCRPQCVLNTDCPFNMACLQSECRDPCPGSCGYNALCTVERHRPVCYCPPEMYGNPYEQCKPQESPRETCASIRCGANTQCKQQNGVLACVCKKNYYGDPLIGCRPECVVNTDCPISKACVNSRCVDPCVDACGVSAQCKVVNHLPICFCPPTHTGDALVACTERTYLPPDNTPCDPNPCGPNSKCRTTPDGYAICSCLPGYRGVPPACQAECMINAECPQNKACINLKCADPCPGTCGVGARCEVLNHNPICSCGANQQGDPFVICEARQNEPPVEQKNPCDPSPCGPNSICQVRGRRPVCSCQPNFIGSPPACRPECVLSSECPQDKACINEKCQNPCANACGANADCHIVAHSAFCSCRAGFEGDAFIGCSAVPKDTPKDVCYPNPCAENAVCSEHNGAAKCTCITPYLGDPYNTGCRPECVLNSDCPSHTACVNQHCRDPCPGVCGTNADCTVANHIPVCECSRGYVGDPFRGCRREVPPPVAPKDPCASCPSNSVCRVVGGRPTCSCPEGYRGTPPACRPECSSSEECPHDRSCINLKCADPCPGLCGINAQCQVINHKPFCSCQRDMIGNPFEQCYPKPAEPVHPCQPSPCGAYSECREIDNRAVCTCAAGMLGTPPNCRPECETDQDCPSNRACFNQKCRDPCVGSCGYNAQCSTRNHRPECYCVDGFEGDPYSGCNPVAIKRDEIIDPCNPSPCGSNAICKDRNGAGSCKCMPNYFGDPYVNCRPECVQSSECPSTKACVNMRCIDPCLGTCGLNSECRVHNHSPYCSCSPGYTGNPSQACRPIVVENLPARHPIDPCSPSPCGPYSICRVLDGHPVCSCQISCSGVPPNCRPECLINAECPRDRTCINQRCIDPCPGTCGMNARCRVVNHNPICSCNAGFIGDPFVQCSPEPTQPILEEEYRNPCQPSPCGVNSVCKVHNNRAVCSCLPNYVGRPPSCRPECAVDSECPMNLACINEKCRNPCLGSCGVNTECAVVAHKPLCSCTPGYSGDPFAGCSIIPIVQQETPMPCNPSPCGANAICKERNGAGSCTCAPEYFGDPYVGCRPECVMNSDCPRTRACINNKCQDPCPGTCGVNAECHVVNHAPSCVCLTGFIGNPFTECRPQPEIRDEPVVQPCQPSPCGPNSVCRVLNNHAVCTCKQNYIGSPPNCRPECVVSSECPLDKSCVKTKCVDPCPGTCGFNARCQVVNHNPICSCKAGFTGDPFVRCIPEERRPVVQETPTDPCIPSPCGPNSQCKAVGHTAACSCLPNYIGRAPNCRPECTSNSQCTPMKACINERCGDPCPGSCGSNALCTVQNHQPNCRCIEGYEGDPYTSCNPVIIHREPEIVDPCNPSPCGINAECNVRNNAGSCTCVKDYYGDPYHECRPECMLSSDCPNTRACLNNKCVDPCPGMCGLNAECFVMNHSPSCSCLPGYTGNPSQACREIPKQIEHTPIDPCRPSPCGPYSQCRNVNEHAVCSCQANYIGSPPACRPECTVSSECAMDKACIKQSCLDPCPGTCGFNARCTVINHNPICSCPSGFTGDPFERCVPEEKQVVQAEPTNPCLPSPCGPNSQCRAVGNVPACSCLPNYVGRAPNCRPECTINAECSGNLACVNEKCADPCPGSCGPNAVCRVIEHSPSCSCQTGYTGDPFSGCTVIPLTPVREESRNPCNPSPCGSNAVCKERNGAGSCTCLPDYFGDPYSGCRPECVTNSDCPRVRACVNNKCADPCPGVCGIDAECYVVNHSPSCACRPGYTGDPFTQCRPPEQPKQNEPINPCTPSPCGPNSICRESNGHAVCTCQASFIGTPPNCRPECIVSSECALDKACIGQKCNDPCPGTCGQNARCQVVNHNPICSCSLGFTGDPFVRCVPVEKAPVVQDPVDPCVPSPCGPNSVCRAIGSTPACSCLPNYIGRAPNCRPECMLNAECPATLACVNERCTNPCVGSCGINARCTVVKHNPICECEAGFTGDPFSVCTEIIPIRDVEPVNPCNPSPCGANAVCKERNGAGSCTCMPEYFGDPYTGCRPECVQNTDCEKSKACMNNKCRDPCPGVCGLNAECVVQNHSPVCFCLEGYTGDPASTCTLAEIVTERPKTPGCQPSPCGPNSQCREINGHPVCSCLAGYIGTPPMCRPECVVSSECSQDRACVNKKCVDPCPGTCGAEARCQVVNHNPICSCPPGFTGDPFVQCAKKEEQKDITPVNPCVPSPCGPNSNCRTVGSQPACSCAANYIGRPPNCRPECTRDAECASNLACQNEKCVNPCAAGCGLNAVCRVINHKPVCTCDEGFEGNPLEQCSRILPPTTERLTPCTPSPCGPNAECRERNNAGACYCLTGYEGNPYDVFSGCRRECDVNADCPDKLACVQYKCVDPCPGVCGAQALCEIQNHVPTCICPEGTVGDPFVQCNLRMADPVTPASPVCDKYTCGPNSICRIQNGVAVCKCQPDMVGSPPNCRPECQQNSDCEANRACVNLKCIDPCPGSCGQNANCNIINHNPICSCAPGFTGDPFTRCYKEIVTTSTTEAPRALCTPSPCGPNAECKVIGDREACSCLPGYIGAPPSCRPECILSTECADNQACIRQKCEDPCPGSCGLNAKCSVSRHTPSCSCDAGFTGDPFTGCQAIIAHAEPTLNVGNKTVLEHA